jgi:PTS system nitrogen regulatory IIA component
MRLADLLHADRVTTSLQGRDKHEVLRELSALFVATTEGLQQDAVYEVLMQREALASTGVGSGVAIPHGRVAGLAEMEAAMGVHRSGVDFESVDGQPVHIFVAVLAPERRPSEHLKALARISRLLRDEQVRGRLVEAPDPTTVLSLVTEEEERH